MHEAAITEALLEQVKGFLPTTGELKLAHVEVGQLEHLDVEGMKFLWGSLTRDTKLAGSRLEIARVAVRIRCGGCGAEYAPDDLSALLCPHCRAARPEVLEGGGVVLRSLEIEAEEDDRDAKEEA